MKNGGKTRQWKNESWQIVYYLKERTMESRRVLIIEDEALIRLYIKKQIFEKMPTDIKVDFAITVFEALKYLEKNKYDLITFDMNLPDGTGHDIYDQLPELNKDAHKIVVTGYPSHQWNQFNHELTNAEYFYALGFDSFWDKMMITQPGFKKHLYKLLNINEERNE